MNDVFRKVSVERLSSPEQLDLLMQVTNSKSWLALLGIISLTIMAFFWAINGRIPVEISGTAVLLPQGGMKSVIALAAGQVSELSVKPGDNIQAGQQIGVIGLIAQDATYPIISLYSGQVVEVKTGVGYLIEPGTAVVTVAPIDSNKALEAVMYVSRSEAQRIHPGMSVKLVPETAQSYGFLWGEVVAVGEYPASRQFVINAIGSEELAAVLMPEEAPIEVTITLLAHSTGAENEQRTPASGSDFALKHGTLSLARIIVDQQAPISLLFSGR